MKILILMLIMISVVVNMTLAIRFHMRDKEKHYYDKDELDVGLNYIASFIPAFNLVTSAIMLGSEIKIHKKKRKELMEQYNQIKECKCCGLYSRSGTVELTEMKLGKPICSHCENEHYRWGYPDIKHDTKLPLCPKLTYKQCKIIEDLKLNKSSNAIADSQLEKYQALQQKKMNEMLDKSVDTLEQYK